MKNLKEFESYNSDVNVELNIMHWKSGSSEGTYRVYVKLKSSSGSEFTTDATTISEEKAKKLVNEFGAKIEERY